MGIIIVKEIKKGVEAITFINKENPKFAEFYVNPDNRPKSNTNNEPSTSTNITESFIVSSQVLPIFSSEGIQ